MDSIRNTTSREELRNRIRQEVKERVQRRMKEAPTRALPSAPTRALPSAPTRSLPSAPTRALPSAPTRSLPDVLPLVHQARQQEEKEKEREARWASFANTVEGNPWMTSSSTGARPITNTTVTTTRATTATSSKEDGWDQGDGRWAAQVVVYETNLPPAVRARLLPAKETHFRFRQKEDEEAFLSALSSPPEQLATYEPTGKKDVTVTASDGRLLGNIHFLHMDGRDIHHPEKYYMKFYLFNVPTLDHLRDLKQRIHQFLQGFQTQPPREPREPREPQQRRQKQRRQRHPMRGRTRHPRRPRGPRRTFKKRDRI